MSRLSLIGLPPSIVSRMASSRERLRLLAYALVDLRRLHIFVKEHVYRLEQGVLKTLEDFGVTGRRVAGAPGIYVRPSLRLLYGLQWSSQNNAFGNSFAETLGQYQDFGAVERHWHQVFAVETEVWF